MRDRGRQVRAKQMRHGKQRDAEEDAFMMAERRAQERELAREKKKKGQSP